MQLSLQCILTKDVHLHPYKVQLTQELTDPVQQREFVAWIMQQQVDADISNKISLSDDTHFQLDDLVNRQIVPSSENLRVIVEK